MVTLPVLAVQGAIVQHSRERFPQAKAVMSVGFGRTTDGSMLMPAARMAPSTYGSLEASLPAHVQATTPENAAAIALFVRHVNATALQSVHFWPQWDMLEDFEQSFGWPTTQAGPRNNLLEFVPGVSPHALLVRLLLAMQTALCGDVSATTNAAFTLPV